MGTEFGSERWRPRMNGGAPVWPRSAESFALHGIAGDVLSTLGPHTEADPHALLVQFLAGFGNLIGRGPHWIADGARHGANLNVVIVGETSKSRKGSSWSQVRRLLESVDPEWAAHRIKSGLSSGEGLIYAVRDPIKRARGTRSRSSRAGESDYVSDPGVADKRLFILESEFASALAVMRRQGNTLSSVMRLAWETGNLQVLTKNSPEVATAAHISVIGHITQDELRRNLTATEAANGFANRFLWVCATRSKLLPDGGSLHLEELNPLIQRIQQAADFARGMREMKRDMEATELWKKVYAELAVGYRGLFGDITARAEPQTMRLAMIYALLDQSPCVRCCHIEAARALWDYCERSCRYIFGDPLGDALAEQAFAAIRAQPAGLTRTQIRDLFARHQKAEDVERALQELLERKLAAPRIESSGGRPTERWIAASDATNET